MGNTKSEILRTVRFERSIDSKTSMFGVNFFISMLSWIAELLLRTNNTFPLSFAHTLSISKLIFSSKNSLPTHSPILSLYCTCLPSQKLPRIFCWRICSISKLRKYFLFLNNLDGDQKSTDLAQKIINFGEFQDWWDCRGYTENHCIGCRDSLEGFGAI